MKHGGECLLEIKKKYSKSGDYYFYYILFEDGAGIPLDRIPLEYKDDQTQQIIQAFKDNPTPIAGEFIQKEIQFFINYCFLFDDFSFLEEILLINALPANGVDRAIEKAVKGEKYEAQIMLMKYKEKINGYESQVSIEDRFAL